MTGCEELPFVGPCQVFARGVAVITGDGGVPIFDVAPAFPVGNGCKLWEIIGLPIGPPLDSLDSLLALRRRFLIQCTLTKVARL